MDIGLTTAHGLNLRLLRLGILIKLFLEIIMAREEISTKEDKPSWIWICLISGDCVKISKSIIYRDLL